jgi:hypothetical protein
MPAMKSGEHGSGVSDVSGRHLVHAGAGHRMALRAEHELDDLDARAGGLGRRRRSAA